MTERTDLLRVVPEPRAKAFTPEEAIDAAKTAFYAARRAQAEVMAAYLTRMLFDPRMVTYHRLRGLQTEARKQVELAQRVEQLIGDAVEAFEATQ
ncbi:MAG TPA: hypothetical protein VJU80_08985 [Solirubrobacteraceae bacterium]|nr:hypothetical protein [Solirubrobacteraceae bacterium]